MVTKMASTHATLTMGFLEEKMYSHMENLLSPTIYKLFCKRWLRYLDDCFIIWDDSLVTIGINDFHDF